MVMSEAPARALSNFARLFLRSRESDGFGLGTDGGSVVRGGRSPLLHPELTLDPRYPRSSKCVLEDNCGGLPGQLLGQRSGTSDSSRGTPTSSWDAARCAWTVHD